MAMALLAGDCDAQVSNVTYTLTNSVVVSNWVGQVKLAMELQQKDWIIQKPGSLTWERISEPVPVASTSSSGRTPAWAASGASTPEATAMATVAADLVTWFGACADLAEAAGRDPEAPHQRAATFHHDPRGLLEQLGAGITELEDLSYVLPAEPCTAMLDWAGGQPAIARVTPRPAGEPSRG